MLEEERRFIGMLDGLLTRFCGDEPGARGAALAQACRLLYSLFLQQASVLNEHPPPDDPFSIEVARTLLPRFAFTPCEAGSVGAGPSQALDPAILALACEQLGAGRRIHGSYYTPRPVVNFMCREALRGYLQTHLPHESRDALDHLVDMHNAGELRDPAGALAALEQLRVCDPACGGGAYLVGALDLIGALFVALHAIYGPDLRTPGERVQTIARDMLYGVERDPLAAQVAQMRLQIAVAVAGGQAPERLPGIVVGDGLGLVRAGDVQEEVGFCWEHAFPEVFAAGGFNIVLANPPYLSTKRGFARGERTILAQRFSTARGQFDAYALFVERSLSILVPRGCYACIVPRPMLTNRHALPLRRLLENEQLRALADPGRVFTAAVESIIIVGQRGNTDERPVHIFESITPGTTPASLPAPQLTTAAGTWRLVPGDERHAMDRLQRLGELARIIRGVECGKRDPAIYTTPQPGAYPLLRGADVGRYQVAFSGYFLMREGEQQRYKPLALQTVPKLLVRRVANDLIAALDTEGHHVLNTLYMLFPYPGCPYAPEYLCAALNSRPLNSYFHQHYLNDDTLFPYLRQEQLAALPIAVPTPAQHSRIVSLVRKLHTTPAITPNHTALEEEIEAMVSRIYR